FLVIQSTQDGDQPAAGELRRLAAGRESCRVQEQKHLAQASRHIAELTVQIVRQRVIVKDALDTGPPSELSESPLHALEQRLGASKKHRAPPQDRSPSPFLPTKGLYCRWGARRCTGNERKPRACRAALGW